MGPIHTIPLRIEEVCRTSDIQHKLTIIDDAGFMRVNDLDEIKDAELYDRLLNEFPHWLTKAQENGILVA